MPSASASPAAAARNAIVLLTVMSEPPLKVPMASILGGECRDPVTRAAQVRGVERGGAGRAAGEERAKALRTPVAIRDACDYDAPAISDHPPMVDGAPVADRWGMPKVLIIDDEPDIVDLVSHHLKAQGYEPLGAATGADGLARAREHPDLIILDLMLPDMDGTEVLRALKAEERTRSIPVIFLSARSDEVDRVVGFELGGEDYVPKPFSPRELALRVRAVLRRRLDAAEEATVRRGGILIDTAGHRAEVDGVPIELTATEFKLLQYLLTHPGRVLERDRLLDAVWGQDVYVTPRTVDTHVQRLRQKLGVHGRLIETVRGVGYRCSAED
jgi:two-component system phosphate regulon response regulator PhoB